MIATEFKSSFDEKIEHLSIELQEIIKQEIRNSYCDGYEQHIEDVANENDFLTFKHIIRRIRDLSLLEGEDIIIKIRDLLYKSPVGFCVHEIHKMLLSCKNNKQDLSEINKIAQDIINNNYE